MNTGLDILIPNSGAAPGLLLVDFTARQYLDYAGGTSPAWAEVPAGGLGKATAATIAAALVPMAQDDPIPGWAGASLPAAVAAMFPVGHTVLGIAYTLDGSARLPAYVEIDTRGRGGVTINGTANLRIG